MEQTLVKIDPKQFGLEESKAADIAAQFQPMLDKMVELEKEYNEVIQLPIEEAAKPAKELRLKYIKIRTGTAAIHKAQKEFYLAGGRFVDGWKNAQLFASQGIEDKLQSIEDYAANKERERIAALQEERQSALIEFEMLDVPNLGSMADDVWKSFYIGAKTQYIARIEAERIAEEQRLAEIEAKQAEFGIIAVIEDEIASFRIDGTYAFFRKESNFDLFLLPEVKECWVNVYINGLGKIYVRCGSYETQGSALQIAEIDKIDYIKTIRITNEPE